MFFSRSHDTTDFPPTWGKFGFLCQPRSPDRAETVDPYHPVFICFGYAFKKPDIGSDKLRPSFPENTEDLRCLHPDFVVFVFKKFRKCFHVIRIDIRGVCCNVFRGPFPPSSRGPWPGSLRIHEKEERIRRGCFLPTYPSLLLFFRVFCRVLLRSILFSPFVFSSRGEFVLAFTYSLVSLFPS